MPMIIGEPLAFAVLALWRTSFGDKSSGSLRVLLECLLLVSIHMAFGLKSYCDPRIGVGRSRCCQRQFPLVWQTFGELFDHLLLRNVGLFEKSHLVLEIDLDSVLFLKPSALCIDQWSGCCDAESLCHTVFDLIPSIGFASDVVTIPL